MEQEGLNEIEKPITSEERYQKERQALLDRLRRIAEEPRNSSNDGLLLTQAFTQLGKLEARRRAGMPEATPPKTPIERLKNALRAVDASIKMALVEL